jgi:hypothetical protein
MTQKQRQNLATLAQLMLLNHKVEDNEIYLHLDEHKFKLNFGPYLGDATGKHIWSVDKLNDIKNIGTCDPLGYWALTQKTVFPQPKVASTSLSSSFWDLLCLRDFGITRLYAAEKVGLGLHVTSTQTLWEALFAEPKLKGHRNTDSVQIFAHIALNILQGLPPYKNAGARVDNIADLLETEKAYDFDKELEAACKDVGL